MHDKQGRQMTVELTDAAASKLTELWAAHAGEYLRLAVDSGGCHGLQYSFSLSGLDESDVRFTPENSASSLPIVVDPSSLEYISGSTIDYQSSFMKSGFTIRDNPRAVSGCGCGTSFDVKNK